ncbi:hypothetical protein D046_5631, partial [Vibrio parahaemolyticus V-223/04]
MHKERVLSHMHL